MTSYDCLNENGYVGISCLRIFTQQAMIANADGNKKKDVICLTRTKTKIQICTRLCLPQAMT